jgi:D-tyrosyl-tRNA(Tyr) deacylase
MLVCAEPADTEAVAAKLVDKVLKLRIFSDDAGKMNRSLQDVQGGLLVVSQFTLAADTAAATGRASAALRRRLLGRALYEAVLRLARERHPGVQSGASAPTCRCTWSTTGR